MYLGQNVSSILPGNVAIGGANMGMVPLFAVTWCPSRDSIWGGFVPLDGQEVEQNLFPDAFAGIVAETVQKTDEATWQSTPADRYKFVEESSAGFFRLPDLNQIQAGSVSLSPVIFPGGCWVIKLFGSVVNIGTVDSGQLASDMVRLQGAFDSVPTPLYSRQAQSTPVPVVLGGLITIANELGETPKIVRHFLINTVADAGWGIGDIVEFEVNYNSHAGGGFTVIGKNASEIQIRAGSSRLPYTLNKGTGALGSLTLASWNYFAIYVV